MRSAASCAALVGVVAEVAELAGDVRDVRVAQRDRALVVARVVVALGQAEPALADVDEVGVGVLEVGRDAERVERAPAPQRCRSRTRSRTSATRRGGGDARQVRLERRRAGGGDRRLVHGGGEVVAHHLAGRAARLRPRRRVLEQLVQQLLVARVDIWNAPQEPYSGGTGLASSQPPFTWR